MIRTLLLNSGSNLTVMVVKLAITFIMTPVFVHNLGNHDYGIWEILGSVLGYMGLLQLGIRPAVTRYAAHYRALEDDLEQRKTYSTAWWFMLGLGSLLACMLFIVAVYGPHMLSDEVPTPERYVWLLLIVGTELLFVFPGYIAESYLEGFQKYYVKNAITVFNSILGAVLLYLWITPENGLVLLALINALGMSIKYLIYTWMLRQDKESRLVPALRYFEWKTLVTLLTFGSKSFVQGVSNHVETATDSIVIGSFIGLAAVPFYTIPANLVQYIRTIGWTITHAFMPLFSDLSARGDIRQLVNVYLRSSRIVVGLLAGMASMVAVLGAPFISLWIGPEYGQDADALIAVLVLFTVMPMLNPFQSRALTAMNEHGVFARWFPVSAALNLALSLWWVNVWGMLGVALASLVPALIFFPFFLKVVCLKLSISARKYLLDALIPGIIPALLVIAFGVGLRFWIPMEKWWLLFAVAVGLGFVWMGLFATVTLKSDERAWIVGRLLRRKPREHQA